MADGLILCGTAAVANVIQYSITHAVMITGFVFMMMVLIEYLNVLSRGIWQKGLRGSPWKQYLLASFLGATPGCLGAFIVVSLYTHREVTLGAVVAAMIATSGDESFLMLSMIPEKAPLIIVLLLCIGLATGFLTDAFLKILLIACLVGLIPESDPHLIFLNLFVEGAVPFSILLASSIVQDGHGMIPMLAESKTDFFKVKSINFSVGLLLGLTGYLAGW